MKAFVKTLVFAACLSVLWSCASSTEKSVEEKLKLAIEQAEQSDEIETDLFLGFKFGMTEKEVDDYLNQLVKEGKVYLNDTREYQYDYNNKSGITYYINFAPLYHDDKLYEITYPIKSSLIPSSGDYIFMASDFIRSERGTQFRLHITEDILGEAVYTCIKDNLVVEFKNTSTSVMKYINAPVERIVSDLKALENQERAKESSSEF